MGEWSGSRCPGSGLIYPETAARDGMVSCRVCRRRLRYRSRGVNYRSGFVSAHQWSGNPVTPSEFRHDPISVYLRRAGA